MRIRGFTTWIVIVLFALLCAQSPVAEDKAGALTSPVDETKVIESIRLADDPAHAAQGFHALYETASRESLRQLQLNSSDTIAIQSAWHEFVLTLPEAESDVAVVPDRDRLSRFIGFMEGRGRIQSPRWWADAILNARANGRYVYAHEFPAGDPESAPPVSKVFFGKNADDKTGIQIDSEFVRVPDDLREKMGFNGFTRTTAALITDICCYIAVYDDIGYPYQLACVERSTSRVRWITKVWGCWWAGASGLHRHSVEILENGDRVAVFGIASSGFHVEAFRVEDGTPLLRFSNTYSGW